MERLVKALPVVFGPIMCVLFFFLKASADEAIYSILFVLRVVQIWYTSKGDAEGACSSILRPAIAKIRPEKALQGVLKEQRSKVDEIKKKTNYYSTHELLQRYEGGPSPGSPRSSLAQPVAPVTPQRKVPRQSVGPPTPLSPQEILCM